MPNAELWADSFVSLAAFCGLLVFMSLIARHEGSSPLRQRFLFGMGTLAALMASRVLYWQSEAGLFLFLTFATAAFIPLAAMLIAEGLMRRHGPPFLKYLTAMGAVFFTILAFFPASIVDPARLGMLFIFQLVSFCGIGWVVLRRDKSCLSASENKSLERIAISLLVIIPALITDYHFGAARLPVRMGGIAILFLCWLGISLSRSTFDHRDILKTFVMLTVSALVAALTIGYMAEIDVVGTMQILAIILSASLLAAIYNDSFPISSDERRNDLLNHLAVGDTSSSASFLRGLQANPLFKEAMILKLQDLGDFNIDLLKQLFETAPIWGQNSSDNKLEPELREQLRWLFEKFEATDIILVSNQPLTLVALAMPQLTKSQGLLTELQAMQRMAMLISKQEVAA